MSRVRRPRCKFHLVKKQQHRLGGKNLDKPYRRNCRKRDLSRDDPEVQRRCTQGQRHVHVPGFGQGHSDIGANSFVRFGQAWSGISIHHTGQHLQHLSELDDARLEQSCQSVLHIFYGRWKYILDIWLDANQRQYNQPRSQGTQKLYRLSAQNWRQQWNRILSTSYARKTFQNFR